MTSDPITISITRTVSPDRVKEVSAWARAGQDLLSASPGYLGSGWVRPDPLSPEWHMLFRFADAASLETWEKSPERAWWIASAMGLVEDSRTEKRTGIEGWFDEPRSVEVIPTAASAPPRWKQMISIFIVFYPLSLGANWLLSPLIGDWPLPLRVLLTVVLVTPVMTYLAMPFVTRALRPWLMRRPTRATR
ncbi:antibiotic biosynthesis monooxygenase [Marisediminicola senii]|uniref:antibiotic biosynthesis monooxygenase n=1 Tax=Marisediminicola senii TaxID=2711233 RepID=UPI0013EBC887|nr:antibiotic biosynthesis monooxygenase [Marisediminicola senii]